MVDLVHGLTVSFEPIVKDNQSRSFQANGVRDSLGLQLIVTGDRCIRNPHRKVSLRCDVNPKTSEIESMTVGFTIHHGSVLLESKARAMDDIQGKRKNLSSVRPVVIPEGDVVSIAIADALNKRSANRYITFGADDFAFRFRGFDAVEIANIRIDTVKLLASIQEAAVTTGLGATHGTILTSETKMVIPAPNIGGNEKITLKNDEFLLLVRSKEPVISLAERCVGELTDESGTLDCHLPDGITRAGLIALINQRFPQQTQSPVWVSMLGTDV